MDFLHDPDGNRKYLTKAERRAFLTAALDEERDRRTFCEMLYYSGARISEVLALTVGRIDLTTHTVTLERLKKRRKAVGGIPSLSFLIATRVNPEQPVDFTQEDASIILLRVMDAANLPNDTEATRLRVEAAQRISGQSDMHWDEAGSMDANTSHLLSFAGVNCRVIGTFFLDFTDPENPNDSDLIWRFGDDISNYYPNRGLKVYKPNERPDPDD